MILPIVKYGHPVLREKGKRIEKITPEVKDLIRDMLETMYDASGVGLAAQQVGKALQLTVIDVREAAKDRPSQLWIDDKPVAPEQLMPLVLINPEVTPAGDVVLGGEGCLSFPEIYAEVARPGVVEVKAQREDGSVLRFRAGGLLGRAVQHETDHLHGILFIDRLTSDAKKEIRNDIDSLQAETKADLVKKH